MSDYRNSTLQPRLVLVRDVRVGMVHPALGRIVGTTIPYTDADERGLRDVTLQRDGETRKRTYTWETYSQVAVLVPEIFAEDES